MCITPVLHTPATAAGDSHGSMKERVKQSVHRAGCHVDLSEDGHSEGRLGTDVKTDLAVRTTQTYQICPCQVGDATF